MQCYEPWKQEKKTETLQSMNREEQEKKKHESWMQEEASGSRGHEPKHELWMQEEASGSMGRVETWPGEALPSESMGLRSRKRPLSVDHSPAISRVNSFYIIENAEADVLESPHKRTVSESDAAGMQERKAPTPPRDTKDTPLMRWRSRAVPPDPKIRQGLSEVAQKQGWQLHRSSTLQGVHDRLDRFTQVLLSGERNSPLKKRFLLVAAIIGSIYAWSLTKTLRAQVQTWVDEPGSPIGLTGIDGSIVVPLSFTFWYVVLCQILLRMMASTPPAESFIFEVAVIYNVLQAGMSAYVAFMMFREFRVLNLNFVGNAAPTHDTQEHRLGTIAILNYHLRKLELCDTFFLIMRKKLYRDSLHLHWSLRMLNIWSWHIACREGCGGDIYFPVVMNALCATVLHVHYFLTLVEPHAVPLRWLPMRSFNPFNRSLASLRRTFVQVVQVGCFQLCLVYGFLSLYAGSYPRIVLVVNIAQCCIGILLYSDFHFRPKSDPDPEPSFEEDEPVMQRQISSDGDDGHNAKMAFSFDSSGWCYFYHFGVAMWIQEHFAEEINKGEMVFSGSSGGAIVGCALATNINIPEVLNSVIHRTYYNARRNPRKLPEEVQYTLETFVPMDGHIRATNFLRVLLTRVHGKPPFFMGEVATQFRSRQHLFDVLAASSCIPVIFGWGKIIDGVRYIDGMFWTSSLVPWRSFKSQSVCRVSCFAAFGCDIGPRIWAVPPIWWTVFPPSQEALEGLFWAGYRDIATAFGAPDGRPGGCDFCSRRQELPAELDKRPRLNASSSRTIDELITVYERTARRDWLVTLGVCFVLNIVVWMLWLRD